MAPVYRCGLGVAFGFALMGAGEVVRRRITPAAAAGLFAAGVGCTYASVFAAYRLYDLLNAPIALGLLTATAALGIAVAARARLISVAIVSLVGGYMAPFLMGDVAPNPVVLPSYLVMLMAVGLALSGWLGGRFAVLRPIVWWATLIIGTAWVLSQGLGSPIAGLTFLAVSWTAIQGELIYTACRGRLIDAAKDGPAATSWRQWTPITSSLSTTVWAVVLAVLALRAAGWADWMGPGAGLVAAAALALVLGGHLRILRDLPENDTERLAAVYWAQAGALLIATIALAASDWAQVICWLSLGLAAVVCGKWLQAKAFFVYSLVVLVFCSGRLLLLASWLTGMTAGGTQVLGLYISTWTGLMAAAGAAWIVVALVMRAGSDGAWRALGHAGVAVGVSTIGASLFSERTEVWAMLTVSLTSAALLAVAGTLLRSSGLVLHGAVLVAIATVALPVTRWWTHTDSPEFTLAGLHFKREALILVYSAMVWLGFAMLARPRLSDVFARVWAGVCVGAAAALVMVSFIHESARPGSVAAVWLIVSLGIGAARRLEPRFALAHFGLAGLFATTAAWAYAFAGPQWAESTATFLLHPGLLMGLVIVGAFVVAARRFLLSARPATIAHFTGKGAGVALSFAAATVLAFAATSLEVARIAGSLAADPTVRGAAVSIWWGAFAFVLIAAGFLRHSPPARRTGLALLAVAMLKAIIFDLDGVPAIWRIASFIGLGLMMLAVAVVYSKMSSVWAKRSPDRD